MSKISNSSSATRSRALLGALFAISGATALVYEVVWFRLIFLRLGGTGLSVATVTASFMAGLGIGAWFFGDRLARRIPPVRLYALLEGFIGVYGLLVPTLVGLTGQLDALMLGADAAGTGARLVRYLLIGIVLLPATLCMGGTLPVLARLVERERLRPGRFVGLLYGLNTTGAVLGAAAAGFILLPRLGFAHTIHVCVAANLLLALAALALARSFATATTGSSESRQEQAAAPTGDGRFAARPGVALLVYAASGLVAFMLQVSWTRILSLVFASSLAAFSLILAIFLTGLGLGALLAARILDRTAAPARALAWTFTLAGATALLGQGLYGLLPGFYLEGLLARGTGFALGTASLLALVTMLPTTLALGMGFPLAVRLATGDGRAGTAARIGWLYAANTSGSVIGAFATALFLIPRLGLAGAAGLAGGVALAIGVVLALLPGGGARRPAWGAVAVCLLAAITWSTAVPPWNKRLMSISVAFWAHDASANQAALRRALTDLRAGGGTRLLFYQDGVTASVAVGEEGPVEGVNNRFLSIDGKIDASTTGDMRTQVLLGQLPLLLAAEPPESALVVGLASGVTVGSVLTHPVQDVVVLEIEAAVHEAATFFDDYNGRPLEDARTTVIVEDARAYIERSPRLFDVIISEPSSAWLSGSSRLFTREAFSAFRRRLAPGGLLCQWLQTYDLEEEAMAGVVRTLDDVFQEVAVFHSNSADLLLIASDQPITLSPEILARHLSVPAVRQDLSRANVASLCSILETLVADPAAASAVLGDGRMNTDDNAWIEVRGPQEVGSMAQDAFFATLRRDATGAAALLSGLDDQDGAQTGALAESCLREGAPNAAASLARRALAEDPGARSSWVLGEALGSLGSRKLALAAFDDALAADGEFVLALISRAMTLHQLGRHAEAANAWTRAAAATGTAKALILAGRGQARLLAGDAEGALADLEQTRALADAQGWTSLLQVDLARALMKMGRDGEARLELEAYLAALPAGASPDLAVIAARGILADLLAGSGSPASRVDHLRELAGTGRQLAVRALLREVLRRLRADGTEAAQAHLAEIIARDPGMAAALRQGIHDVYPAYPWPQYLVTMVESLSGS
jgi:spermidine synthase